MPVVKPTKVLSVAEHLLEAIRRIDPNGHLRRALVRTPARIAGAWQNRLVGSCGGRVVRTSQKGGDGVGKTKCGKGTKVVDIVDSNGTPLAVHLTGANHNEVKLIEPTLDRLQIPHQVPEHLVYDRAADSEPLRKRLLDERGASNWFALIEKAEKSRRPKTIARVADASTSSEHTVDSTISAVLSSATKPRSLVLLNGFIAPALSLR